MATMRIFRPVCSRESDGCKARATYEVTAEGGGSKLYCGAHAKAALFELTKAESEKTAKPVAVTAAGRN